MTTQQILLVAVTAIAATLFYGSLKPEMPPKIKLTYFHYRWTTETVRLLLKYGGIEFEDNRIAQEDWEALKPSIPFGQLPVYEEDGKVVPQSIAIARYVAKKVNLNGADAWEDLEIDAIVDTLSDLKDKMLKYFDEKDEEAKAKLKETYLKETIPYYLERFEARAKENNGHLVANKLTWADFYFTTASDIYSSALEEDDLLAKYPNLQKVKQNVIEIPAVKEWIKNRPATDF